MVRSRILVYVWRYAPRIHQNAAFFTENSKEPEEIAKNLQARRRVEKSYGSGSGVPWLSV